MKIKLDADAIAAIEAALNRGNDAKVKRKGDGVIVAEIEEKIKYRACPIVDK